MNRLFTYFVLLVSLLCCQQVAYAQICGTPGFDGPFDIGGQVNTYYPPLAGITLTTGATSVALTATPADVFFGSGTNTYSANSKSISNGDLLLIIQMQDASINSSNSNLYGASSTISGPDNLGGTGYTSLGQTGLFEYVIATNDVPLTGGTLTFRGAGAGGGVVNTYYNADNTGSMTQGQRTFQVVRVPQYSNVRLIATIYAPPFNGKAGGIIAFDVAGTMNFNGQIIDASARGFRAGFGFKATDVGTIDANSYVANSTSAYYGGKGESIVGTPQNTWDGFIQVAAGVNTMPGGGAAKGAPGNGGGGGNNHNSGGGGGGNGGYGGVGGVFTGGGAGGRPGSIVYLGGAPAATRLMMGGGGGGGQVNNADLGDSGGVGGGIILLNVGKITGTGTINANGGTGQNAGWCTGCVTIDGAGGGGAGGTIFLKVSNPDLTASLTINVNGGAGGTCANDHGPGGGGGGGLIYYSTGAAGTVNKNVIGGITGTTPSTGTRGAAAGQVGQALSFTISSLPLYLQGGGTSCYPELSTKLSEANAGLAGTRMPGASVTYTLTISNKAGRGGVGGVLAELSLPVGISYQSVSVAYTGGSGGDSPISVTTNQGSSIRPRFGNFVVAPGGSVVLTLIAQVDCTALSGTYHASAQAYYFDPTRSINSSKYITPYPMIFTLNSISVSTSYASGGSVSGTNYDGSLSSTEDVLVSNMNMIPTINSNSPICMGSMLSLSASVIPNVTYHWIGPNGFISTTTQNTIVVSDNTSMAMIGTYTVTVTSCNGCTSAPASLHVLSGLTPELSVAMSESHHGSSLISGSPLTYTVTVSNQAGVCDASGLILDVLLPTGITYQSVTVTYIGLSGGDGSASVTTNQGSLLNPRFGNFVIGPGGSVVLTLIAQVDCTAPSGTYHASAQAYYFDPTRSINSSKYITPYPMIFSATNSISVSTSYASGGSVSGTNYDGSLSSTEDVLVSNMIPIIDSNSPICMGSMLSLSASVIPNVTYQWIGPNGFISTTTQNRIVVSDNSTMAMAGTYTVTLTNSNGCTSAPASLHVLSGLTPELSVAMSESHHGSSLISGSPLTYTVTVSNQAGVCNASGLILDVLLPTGITYQSVTVTYIGLSGGDGSASVTTNQGSLLNPRFGNFVIGPGGSVVLTLIAKVDCTALSGTYHASAQAYYFDPTRSINSSKYITPYPMIFSAPNSISVSTSYASGGSVSGTNYDGSLSSTEDVLVSNMNMVPTINSNSPICMGSMLSLSASVIPNVTYHWIGPNGFISTTTQNTIVVSDNTSMAMIGTYTVTVTNSNGCTSAPATASVIVKPLPPTPIVSPNFAICSGGPLKLIISSNTIPNPIYNLIGPNNFNSTTTLNTILISSSVSTNMTGVYTLTVSSNGCTSLPATTYITVNSTPITPTVNSRLSVCEGDSLEISATDIPLGALYSWTKPDGSIASSINIIIDHADSSISGTYTLTVSSNGCASPPASVYVMVNSKPTVNAGKSLTVAQNSSQKLMATASGNSLIFNWTPSAYLDNDAILNPTVIHPNANITYRLTVTTLAGCTAYDDLTIFVPFNIPNTFTPNGDGIEDTWGIGGVANYPYCSVIIFNSWGALVYESTGYKQPWDGTLNGHDLPIGSYYYVIDLNDGGITSRLSGYVAIVR